MAPEPLQRLAINTATLGHQWPLGRVIDAIAGLGIGAFAPWRRDFATLGARQAGRRAREAGLAVSCLCRGSYFVHGDEAQHRAIRDDNRRAVEEAHELGAPALCLVVGGLPPGSRDLALGRRQVADGIAELLEFARPAGVRLAIEPLHPMYAADRSCVSTLACALDMAEALGPDVGVAVDAYHVWWDPELERGIARAGRDRLLLYHICDWLVPTRDLLMDRGMMGDGVIDLPRLRGLVRAAGYDGYCEVEIFSAQDWWRRDPLETLKVCCERFATVC